MTDREFYMRTWESERPTMVRVFRALPAERLDYRPHSRSRSAGELASLLVYVAQTAVEVCDTGQIGWNVPKVHGSLDSMIVALQLSHQLLLDRFRKLNDDLWAKNAPFLVNGQDVWGDTVGGLLWMGLLDSVHHRGRLSTYIRPIGVKSLPSMDRPPIRPNEESRAKGTAFSIDPGPLAG